MNLLEKTDEEIIKIAEPFWNNLIVSSNKKITADLPEISQLKCFMAQMKLR